MRAVNEAALAQEAMDATQFAIEVVKASAAFHRRAYHTRHEPKPFYEALERLDLQLSGDRAYLSRCNFDVQYIKENQDGQER